MKVTGVLLLIFATTTSAKLYFGDKVFQLVPSTYEQLDWLRELVANADGDVYDFWTRPSLLHAPVDIHVSKDFLDEFQIDAGSRGMNATVNVDDLQDFIDEVEGISHQSLMWKAAKATAKPKQTIKPTTTKRTTTKRTTTTKAPKSILGRYPRYAEITAWLELMCKNYASMASCGSVGTSFEKRDIRYLKLSTGQGKKAIVIESGVHGREWLGVATNLYIIDRLLTTSNTEEVAKRMLNNYDWIFVPVVNTDGYEYTRSDRMWRKTRSRRSGVSCVGTDPNRNYKVFWGTSGDSGNPCSDVYRGPSAFSEPETKAMSDFLTERQSEVLGFFTMHTYGQMWLLPYNDKNGHYPPDYSEVSRVAKIGSKALMAVNKSGWSTGTGADILYSCSGTGSDYAKSIGVKYSYTLELRGTGFVVAESAIQPSGKEVWAGITAAVDAMTP